MKVTYSKPLAATEKKMPSQKADEGTFNTDILKKNADCWPL